MIWMRGSIAVLLVSVGLVSASRAYQGATRQPTSRSSAAHVSKQRTKTSPTVGGRPEPVALAPFVERFCIACHSGAGKTAKLALGAFSRQAISAHPEAWEKVARKLRARQMPPVDQKRPGEREYEAVS